MKFFSGFSIKNEAYLFNEYVKKSEFTVCGFSQGAILALNEVTIMLKNSNRVDTLQLFSPAFFQSKDESFKRLQLTSYMKNKDVYLKMFQKACFAPYEEKIIEHRDSSYDELKELIEYEWSVEKLIKIEKSGVKIEVYLGGEDKIIDIDAAKEFFLKVATVTYIKSANHFLQII